MKKNFKVIAFYIIAIIAMIALTNWLIGNSDKKDVTYSDIRNHFVNEEVKSFEVSNSNELVLVLNNEEEEEVVYKLR